MEEALIELGALHARLNGGLWLLKALSEAEEARKGEAHHAAATRALYQYLSDVSYDMEECLGRAALALEST